MKNHHKKMVKKNKFKKRSLLLFGVASLFWFIFRTGTKPSRIVYPCQRAALVNSSMLLSISIPLSLTAVLTKTKKFLSKKGTTLALLIIVASVVISSEQFWEGLQPVLAVDPNQEIQLALEPRNATAFPASDIYAVSGRAYAHISELMNLMGSHGLLFYKSGTSGVNQGPDGLIARDDVVLIKINEEWAYRGGTNTDVLKELIQAIVDHPDGFVGEIVVADNGQWGGSMNWPESNAEDITQSTQDVVNMFSPYHNVSTYTWRPIRGIRVNEYSAEDMNDGYIVYDTADPETGIYVSYPKFRTQFGTYISFKYGIWNGTGYEKRLKVINMPVLKSHQWYGVTASLKHYMGVQSEGDFVSGGLANGHVSVATGGMGTLMVETGLPTLNIIDAIWINANPGDQAGPSTPYDRATRVNVLMASLDPVAVDYWAAKHVLVQAASLIGYSDTHTLDPDNTDRSGVYTEAFGVWLNLTKNEILAEGYNITTDENHMNVYVYAETVHGIAVTNVTLSETVVTEGDSLNISVTTENQGDSNEDFNLTTYANTTAIQTKAVTLSSKNSTTITFTWNTTGFAQGNYTISAYANPVPDENDTADNTYIDGTVFVYAPLHDVAVINVTASPTPAQLGQPISINVTVENQGDYTETFTVSVYYTRITDPLINTTTITLTAGVNATLTFEWTPNMTGRYEILAEAGTVPGETDTADNTRTIILYVEYRSSNAGSQSGESINGSYIATFIFTLFATVMIVPEFQKNKKRSQKCLIF